MFYENSDVIAGFCRIYGFKWNYSLAKQYESFKYFILLAFVPKAFQLKRIFYYLILNIFSAQPLVV